MSCLNLADCFGLCPNAVVVRFADFAAVVVADFVAMVDLAAVAVVGRAAVVRVVVAVAVVA